MHVQKVAVEDIVAPVEHLGMDTLHVVERRRILVVMTSMARQRLMPETTHAGE